jgi:hypothetical protein
LGYLDNSSVTVDAILTNKGRQLLAAGGRLNITKFALSDDEVDYDLWNASHTLGSNYYGKVIEDMPILEALPDETQMLRYKLVTLPKDVTGIPQISVPGGNITFRNLNESQTITPSVNNYEPGNKTLGYTAILSDDTVATLEVAPDGAVSTQALAAADTNVTNFLDDEVSMSTTAGKSIVRVGTKFIIRPKALIAPKNALLTIVGNETGGFKTVTISITAATISSTADIQQYSTAGNQLIG